MRTSFERRIHGFLNPLGANVVGDVAQNLAVPRNAIEQLVGFGVNDVNDQRAGHKGVWVLAVDGEFLVRLVQKRVRIPPITE